MSAVIVLNHYLEEFQTMANTMTDIPFDNLPFLTEKEPLYNMKGQKVSKSYVCPKGKDVVRIMYDRLIGDFMYNDVVYSNIFYGLRKRIQYFDWKGDVAYEKVKQKYEFNLEPVYLADGSETIVGFSSQKQRQILKSERYSADDYLSSKNPTLYATLFEKYQNVYNAYLRTGDSSNFIAAMNSESDFEVLEVLNKEVFGFEPMTVKELIIYNLQ